MEAVVSPPAAPLQTRRCAFGAEPFREERGTHFRVWAPERRTVEVVLCDSEGKPQRECGLSRDEEGFFAGFVEGASAGDRYFYRLDDAEKLCPDPASRSQPDGPHGASQIVDPCTFEWSDASWRGVAAEGQVIYEMHIGSFTPEGTWQAAQEQLQELADLGVTVVELMPVNEFPGRFGWGYDGVQWYAPTRLYGKPDDMRRFVDRAHAVGIGVILDVVYNHLGPDGNYMSEFAPTFFSDTIKTDWGDAINYDGRDSSPVREFVVSNARCWIEEFHLDGLRLDATQDIHDRSGRHIIEELTSAIREAAAPRSVYVVAENEPQHTRIVRPVHEGGYGADALWNDDFHHSAMVVLSGHKEAYYSDYLGSPQEFVSAAKYGYLYQGQRYEWQQKRRGTPTFGLPRSAFIAFTQNHDQIANSGQGIRCHQLASAGNLRAMTGLLLLGPWTPMLFQGQEFAAGNPFYYFADHREDLAKMVHEGRKSFMAQFPSLACPEVQAKLADPADPATFMKCKLDFTERQRNRGIYQMHRDLLKLRREDPVIRQAAESPLDGAVLGESAFVLRFFGSEEGDRLVVVNFGRDLNLTPAPEPLLAPGPDGPWETYWSSDAPDYGGSGTPPLDSDRGWRIPGASTVLLGPARRLAPSSGEDSPSTSQPQPHSNNGRHE
jgi:maltooligosyltrehalose trehalohydrolase